MKYRLIGLIPADVHQSIQRNLDLVAQLQRDTDKRIKAFEAKKALVGSEGGQIKKASANPHETGLPGGETLRRTRNKRPVSR